MQLKYFIPVDDYLLTTPLALKDVQAKLAQNIAPFSFRLPFSRGPGKPFLGELDEKSFSIRRATGGNNGLVPVVKGSIQPIGNQVQIQIKIRPSLSTLAFMAFWLGMMLLATLFLLASWYKAPKTGNNGFSGIVFIPPALFIFGWLFFSFGIRMENSRARLFLSDLLGGKIVR